MDARSAERSRSRSRTAGELERLRFEPRALERKRQLVEQVGKERKLVFTDRQRPVVARKPRRREGRPS